MNGLVEQLVAAYREEEALYGQIRSLVQEQARIMAEGQDPQQVFGLCARVEDLMRDIAVIERAIEPAKVEWMRERPDPDGRLDAALAAIQTLIEETAATQEMVQERLMALLRRQQERARVARASVSASKARAVYRAGAAVE